MIVDATWRQGIDPNLAVGVISSQIFCQTKNTCLCDGIVDRLKDFGLTGFFIDPLIGSAKPVSGTDIDYRSLFLLYHLPRHCL